MAWLVRGGVAPEQWLQRYRDRLISVHVKDIAPPVAGLPRLWRDRADGMEAVAIVTPNHLHYPVAGAALHAGFHVICDKPLTTNVAEADELVQLAADANRIFAVIYNYSGYPMVRQARAMVACGDIGALRVVQVEYPQAWLAGPLETTGQKQVAWRTDPSRSGSGGAIGDIGSHAFHLACFVTGRVPAQILADLSTFVTGRQVDDNAHVLLRFADGARAACYGRARSPMAPKMRCGSACMAKPADSNGRRRNRIAFGSPPLVSRGRY